MDPSVQALWNTLSEYGLPLVLLSGLLGLWGIFRWRRKDRRGELWMLFAPSTMVLLLVLYAQSEGESFLIPYYPVIVILSAEGASGVRDLLRKVRWIPNRIVSLLLVPCILVTAIAQAPKLRSQRTDLALLFARELIDQTEENAWIITSRSDLYFLMKYVQMMEGQRPDVVPVFFHILPHAWYREVLARETSVSFQELALDPKMNGWALRQEVMVYLVERSGMRPLYMTGLTPCVGPGAKPLRRDYEFLPVGLLFKIVPESSCKTVPPPPRFEWDESVLAKLARDERSREQFRIAFLAQGKACVWLDDPKRAAQYGKLVARMAGLGEEISP